MFDGLLGNVFALPDFFGFVQIVRFRRLQEQLAIIEGYRNSRQSWKVIEKAGNHGRLQDQLGIMEGYRNSWESWKVLGKAGNHGKLKEQMESWKVLGKAGNHGKLQEQMESWKVIGIDGIMEGYRNSWNHRNLSQQATCIPHI